MARQPYRLSPSEVEILRLGADDPDIITDYFYRPPGEEHGFRLDHNFTDRGKWQKAVHHAEQTDIVVVGGFGTGKTGGIGMSASVWCITTPYFKFLNVAQKQYQAKQMYDFILTAAAGTPMEKLIWEKPRRPHPRIVFKYYIGDRLYESSMEFMSVDKDATGILSWEGDWINIEEAGLLDNLSEIVISVGSRLRGTVRGRERLGRLSMISNPWDNFDFWHAFDLAEEKPDEYLSIVVSSRDNKNVTEKQLKKMLARIPEDERSRFIDGTRPEGKGKYFAKEKVFACESRLLSELTQKGVDEGRSGYILSELKGVGPVHFQLPRKSSGNYILLGDPGIDNAPKRNSPVLMVYEIPDDFPKRPGIMVAFWWGNGNNQISPFVAKLLEWRAYYRPVYIGVDSTSTQKNTAEIINVQYLGFGVVRGDELEKKEPLVMVDGLDFSGAKKMGYLVTLRMFIEAGLLVWPKVITGIRSQLTNYDPENDKKLAQDIVATLSMVAYVMRALFSVSLEELYGSDDEDFDDDVQDAVSRERRLSGEDRSRRSALAS